MELLKSDGPIIACSTNLSSNSAIAVIRLSGFESIDFILPYISISKIKPRYAHFCKLFDDNKKILDEIILNYFKGPHSYTGENTLELSVHGNVINTEKIIEFFITNFNFKRALPGEFSYRALKNNKLSVSQVEGLDLLLNANSNFILNQGFSLLSGDLQHDYQELYKNFLNHRSSVELSIDFLDDIGEEQSSKNFNDSLSVLKNTLNKLIKRVKNTNHLIEPEIVLFGDPNAGKSTLFNDLYGSNRSIVTDIAGTTRDYISESIKIGDNFYKLIDTAGIRVSEDSIELEGINRSKEKAEAAFFKILLLNPNQENSDLNAYLSLRPDLILITHIDQYTGDLDKFMKSIGPIEPENNGPIKPENNGPIKPENSGPIEPENNGPIEPVKCNLLSDFNEIESLIKNKVNEKYLSLTSNNPLVLDRHKDLLVSINNMLHDYSDLAENEDDISIISSELNTIGDCISELIGIVSPDDVLHNIFNNFCIGK